MVMVKAEVQEKEMLGNQKAIQLSFQTEEPIFRRTEHFHKDLFFHTKKHLDYFADYIGQEAINLVKKIMEMKNTTSITVFNCDEHATDYDTQRLAVVVDMTNAKPRTLPGIKSYIKKLLAAVPIEQEVVKIAL